MPLKNGNGALGTMELMPLNVGNVDVNVQEDSAELLSM